MSSRADLIATVADLHHRLFRLTARHRSLAILATNLTMQQTKVLTILSMDGPTGGTELARGLDISMATVTGIVDRLIDKGFVSRSEDPNDRRVRRIELTTAGRDLVGEMNSGQHAFMNQLVSRLTDDDLAQLIVALGRVVDILVDIESERPEPTEPE